MKSIQYLVYEIADKDKDDPIRHGLITLTVDEMQRFHDLAIAQYREGLLAGVGEAVCLTTGALDERGLPQYVNAYTADQMAAAVLWEREACAQIAEKTYSNGDGIEAWFDHIAAAIRGQL